MYSDHHSLDKTVKKLNTISPSFCPAKWMHSTIHLHLGQNHSCYLPPTHKISTKEIESNPSALHNSGHKKKQRKKMLNGERPNECRICWEVEDLGKNLYSDRHYRGQDSWTKPFIERISKDPWDQDINPSYLEVSFSSTCNFKCSYCNPSFSSTWENEVKKYGGYKLKGYTYMSPTWLKLKNLLGHQEDSNPYLIAFWKWWPKLRENLMFFRITGGEPLLSPQTFKLLDDISVSPLENLELSLNSNLGISDLSFNKFLDKSQNLLRKNAIKTLTVHTSLDSYGVRAEYIRNGLSFTDFEAKVKKYLEFLPSASLSVTCTFNIFSVTSFTEFLTWILDIRKTYQNEQRDILLDIPHLRAPEHQSCQILTADYLEIMKKNLLFMTQNQNEKMGIRANEIEKVKRIYEWMKIELNNKKPSKEILKQRQNFYLFFKEHDKRRKTSLVDTFPEMKPFYNHCKKLTNRWSLFGLFDIIRT